VIRPVPPLTHGRLAASRGQVLALFAMFLVVLLGFTALAVDYGTYLLARREYQNVADAGAIAGSAYLTRPIDAAKQGDAREAAWEAVKSKLALSAAMPSAAALANGITSDGWTVWIATPPTDAGSNYLGDASLTGNVAVYVRVQRDNPAFLSRIFGINGKKIRAWATAGTQPTRWAVIALCPRNGACPSTTESVALSGSNTILRVVDGDMGANWGLKINSNADDRLQLPTDSQTYLVDTTCGPSRFLCYPAANISDGSGTAKEVRLLPAPVEDPNYPQPSWIDDSTTAVPWRGDTNHDVTVPNGSGTVQNPSATNVGCGPASPRIGPGRYRDLDIRANSCVILDPTLGLTSGQHPGIFVITRNFNIGNSSFVIGDGVTVFWANSANPFNPSGGIVINNENAAIAGIPAGSAKYGAWTTLGNPTWSTSDGINPPTWVAPSTRERGLAFYIRRASGSGHTAIFNMSGTSPLMFLGLLYGPTDNVNVSGSGSQAAVGQIIGWTVGYNGNTTITQIFDGPDEVRTYLLEPRTGQPD
jgi:Flp pilus assembly protein TadG